MFMLGAKTAKKRSSDGQINTAGCEHGHEPSELHERIAREEDLHTEFKEWPVHPDDLAASLVAFANTDGGQLIIGVANNRVIVGVEDADGVTRDVDNVAFDNCEPPITVVQEVLYPSTLPQGKPIVVVNIPKGDMRPYRTTLGVYYIRTTSGRRWASRQGCSGCSKLLKAYTTTKRPCRG
jgi:ATP-dependent DNA helicase RecG